MRLCLGLEKIERECKVKKKIKQSRREKKKNETKKYF